MKNKYLVEARKNKGFTQEQLANLLNYEKATVSNWENGHSNPKLDDALALSILLDKKIEELFFNKKVQVSYIISERLNDKKEANLASVSNIS